MTFPLADTATLTALSGLLGTLIGGSASVATTWVAHKTVSKRELIREEMRKRETLYGEFIGECAKLLMESFTHSLEKPETMLAVLALINRIRLCASQMVLEQAERLLRRITDQYLSPNLTLDELHELARSTNADLLREFAETCRAELVSIQARM
jgi:hypothetical protein